MVHVADSHNPANLWYYSVLLVGFVGACLARLEHALEDTAEAYWGGQTTRILDTKNRFYDVLFEGAGSETLSSMIELLHMRIWRWRALGLSHPKRSSERSKESIDGLLAVLEAIRERDADLAEKTMRDEARRAAAEVMRLLVDGA